MALYTENFNSETIDAQPSNWTEQWHDTVASALTKAGGNIGAGDNGSKQMYVEHTSDERYAISFDTPGTSVGDCEILALINTQASSDGVARLVARGSGDSAAETGLFLEIHWDYLELYQYNAGAAADLSGNLAIPRDTSKQYWARFSCTGSSGDITVKGKVWEAGTPEPEKWSLIGTSTAAIASGWCGFSSYRGGSSAGAYVDYFAVDTTGATVPLPDWDAQLVNPGAEAGGEGVGWTDLLAGAGTTPQQRASGADDGGRVVARNGSYYFALSSSGDPEAFYQDWDVPAILTAAVDRGEIEVAAECYFDTYSADNDEEAFILECYSSTTTKDETTLLVRYELPWFNEHTGWQLQLIERHIPPGTRCLRLRVDGDRASGTQLSAYIEDFALALKISDRLRVNVPIVNPARNPSDMTGWTTDNYRVSSAENSGLPLPCGNFFDGGSAATSYLEQTVELETPTAQLIDIYGQSSYVEEAPTGNELCIFFFDMIAGSYELLDTLQLVISFLDASNGVLGTLSSANKAWDVNWEGMALSVVPPQGTRKIKFRFDAVRSGGTINSGFVSIMDSYLTVPRDPVGWATPSMEAYSSDEGTVLYSSEYSTSYKGWYALDHDRGTAWISLAADGAPSVGTPQYIGFQFPSARTIRAFSFITRNSANHDHPKDFTLQGSNNGSDWDVLHAVTGLTGLAANEQSPIYEVDSPGSYSYYRLHITARDGSETWVSVGVLQLWQDGKIVTPALTSATVPTGATVTTSSDYDANYPGWEALNQDDSNSATCWICGNDAEVTEVDPEWWQIEFPIATRIDFFRFITRNASNFHYPADFVLQGSDDGVYWDDLVAVEGLSGLNYRQPSPTFFVPNAQAYVYYRIYITKQQRSTTAAGTYWVGMAQVELCQLIDPGWTPGGGAQGVLAAILGVDLADIEEYMGQPIADLSDIGGLLTS